MRAVPEPAPRILVVDDDAATRTVTVQRLRDAGYEVFSAANKLAASLSVIGHGPDVIACSSLPGEDVQAFLTELAADRETATFR